MRWEVDALGASDPSLSSEPANAAIRTSLRFLLFDDQFNNLRPRGRFDMRQIQARRQL